TWSGRAPIMRPRRPGFARAQRRGPRQEVVIAPPRATWGRCRARAAPAVLAVRLIQIVALAVAAFVALGRPGDPIAIAGAMFLGTIGVFSVTFPFRIASVWRALPAPIQLVLWLPFMSSAALGASLCSFFASFPRRRIQRWRGWLLLWLPLAPGLAGHAAYGYFMLYRGGPAPRMTLWPATLVFASIAYVIGGLTILVLNYR